MRTFLLALVGLLLVGSGVALMCLATGILKLDPPAGCPCRGEK